MLSNDKQIRFPRAATARRLQTVADGLRLYAQAYWERRDPLGQPKEAELLAERYEFLDQLAHDIEDVTRSLQYWR